MSTSKPSGTRPWSMTFAVAGEPRCPGCCEKLAGVVIVFREGWAWCPVCEGQALYADVHLRYVLAHDIMQRCSILSHGLRFYIPVPFEGKMRNALDHWEWLINHPAPEPAEPAPWPGFDMTQLPHCDPKGDVLAQIPWRRRLLVPSGFVVVGITEGDRAILIEDDLTRTRKPSFESDPHPDRQCDEIGRPIG